MFYVKVPLVVLWLVLSCVIGLVMCLVLWGNRDIDHYFARFFSWGVVRICRTRVELEGEEHLMSSQPCIYVANHQSGMDMSHFGTMYPKRTVVVGKKELLYIPFFGIFFKAAGNIIIDRAKRVSAVAGLAAAVERMRQERLSVWIFPEGTRNRSAEPMMPFKKGGFYMAVQAQVPVVPIICSPIDHLISWKHRRLGGGSVRVRVLPPIASTGYGDRDVDRLSDDVRARMIEGLKSLAGSVPQEFNSKAAQGLYPGHS